MDSQKPEMRLCGRQEYYRPLLAFLFSKGALNYGLQDDLRFDEYRAMNDCSQHCGASVCRASQFFEYRLDTSPLTRHPEVPMIEDDRPSQQVQPEIKAEN